MFAFLYKLNEKRLYFRLIGLEEIINDVQSFTQSNTATLL